MEASSIPAPQSLVIGTRGPVRLLRLRTDEQLVALFRRGDEAAFQAIHDRYRQRLFSYARQMLSGSRQDAEDAMQDVFIRAYGALRADDRPIALKAWLYRVAHNRCIDHLRRSTPPAADVFELSRRPLHDPLEEAERREQLSRLVADIQHLPEQQRSALLMREIDGMSYTDLAHALDVTVPAIKSLLVRARVGLVEAGEARDTCCDEIRGSIALSHGRGVRCTGLVKRHLRDCPDCTEFRVQIKAVNGSLAALNPTPLFGPVLGLAQMIGLGGAGTSAAAGGGTIAVTGVGGAAVTKMAVAVCCVAMTAGGATEVTHRLTERAKTDASATTSASDGSPRSAANARAASAAGATTTLAQFAPIELPSARTLAGLPVGPEHGRSEEAIAKLPAVSPLTEDDTISPHVATAGLVADAGGAEAPVEVPAADHASTPQAQQGEAPSPEKTPTTESSTQMGTPLAAGADADTEVPAADDPTVDAVIGGAQGPAAR